MVGKLTNTQTFAEWFGYQHGAIEGNVGLEIETETERSYKYVDGLTNYWRTEPDGSLRNNGVEFIFRRPLAFGSDTYNTAMELFSEQAKTTKFLKSTYTSVHVHLNMQPKTLVQIMNFIALYQLFEEVLAEYCGNSRNGNLFCLKTSNAESLYRTVNEIAQAIHGGQGQDYVARLDNNRMKYSGLNLVPLRNFGSLEVRTHPGCTNVELINRWVGILHQLYTMADKFANPVDIVDRLLNKSVSKKAFADSIFKDYAKFLPLSDLNAKMVDGIWYASSLGRTVSNWKKFGLKSPKSKKVDTQKKLREDYILSLREAGRTLNTLGWTTTAEAPRYSQPETPRGFVEIAPGVIQQPGNLESYRWDSTEGTWKVRA